MVEFALIAPLFFTILFGIIEYSLITTSIGVANFAAKDAARLGSLLGRQSNTADQQMLNDIKQRASGIITSKITQVEIFKADTGGNMVTTAGCPCEDIYDGTYTLVGTKGWPESNRNDTLIDADFLGVKISFTYTYLTGFVAGGLSSLQLSATSVQRIEPQDYQQIGHGVSGAIVKAPGQSYGTFPQTMDAWRDDRREGGTL